MTLAYAFLYVHRLPLATVSPEDRLYVALCRRGDSTIGEFIDGATGYTCDGIVDLSDVELVERLERAAASLSEPER